MLAVWKSMKTATPMKLIKSIKQESDESQICTCFSMAVIQILIHVHCPELEKPLQLLV